VPGFEPPNTREHAFELAEHHIDVDVVLFRSRDVGCYDLFLM
jgi:hypothetical protein